MNNNNVIVSIPTDVISSIKTFLLKSLSSNIVALFSRRWSEVTVADRAEVERKLGSIIGAPARGEGETIADWIRKAASDKSGAFAKVFDGKIADDVVAMIEQPKVARDDNRIAAVQNEKTESLHVLYVPTGPAGEYASCLAFNPWIGCEHGCRYQKYNDQMACYAPGAFRKSVDDFRCPTLKTDILRKLERDLKLLVSGVPLRAKCGNEWVDVSPQQHIDLPRKILELFSKYG